MAGRDLLSLVVTLGNVRPEGKPLSLDKMKLSLLNEEARQNHRESISNLKGLVTEGDSNRGRDQQRSPQNWDKSGTRSKSSYLDNVEVERKTHVLVLWEAWALPI